jgi:hypothetical protein
MQAMLAKKLVEKGVIRQYTEFEAYYNAHGLSCVDDARLLGRFRITAAKLSRSTAEVVFEAKHSDSLAPYRFTNAQIVTLDGMPPARLAAIYNLTLAGDEIATGKRRGRKPRLPAAA